jgi:anti-sigma B factor antagonist
MPHELASMQQERRDGCVILRLSGEIDLSNAEDMRRRIAGAAEGSPLAILDLTELEYIDSQGLRVLRQLATELGVAGTELELVAPPGSIARDVLEITRFGDAIPIRDVLDP